MDEALRELERALAGGDEGARVRLVAALLRAGRVEDAWKRARASAELAEVAGRIFEAAGAPFTLSVLVWPLEHPKPESPVRLLGVRNGERPRASIGRAWNRDLRLRHPDVAKGCCGVRYEGGMSFRLLDSRSKNGTWMRGGPIEEAELGDGDVFSPATPEIEVELTLGWKGEPWPSVPLPALEALL